MPATEKVSLKEMVHYIRDWKNDLKKSGLIIAVVIIFGAAIGITYAWTKKPEYIASTSFVLEEGESSGGGLGQYAGLASMVGVDLGGGAGGIFQGDNIMELYRSRTMILKTLLSPVNFNGKNQLIIDRYIEMQGWRKNWEDKPEMKSLTFDSAGSKTLSRIQDSIITAISANINKNNLTVSKLDKKLNIISVQVSSTDEQFAKAFNNEIVKNVNDFYTLTKTKKSKDNIKIFQRQTDSVRAVMNGAIFSSASTMDATPNLNPTRQILRVSAQKAQYNAEANKEILGELLKNLELAKISMQKETPLIQVIDEPVFPLEKKAVGKKTGGIIGGVLAGLLIIGFLSIKYVYKQLMQ
ncbi:GumC domain-containing protein [Pedobacter metabolipauper]|uniref:Subunit length determinant protein n=1 Tax=Pedobacter metabolipauper TaxID=425513 RepID=A0A4R6SYY7_9SPHI|nr:lipopolysaccharide biosynthesis protein [Pedobacter metabolipauper]TDQ09904.1 subunit length determinant protein [Pedobacter metabolipauper]